MSAPKTVPPQQAAIILRSQRLRATVNSEGWGDVLKIWDATVDDALQAMDSYRGTDEKQIVLLTVSWKTAKALRANFLATLDSQVREGDQVAMQFRNPQAQTPKAGEERLPSATAVLPLCDAIPTETQEDAEPEPGSE